MKSNVARNHQIQPLNLAQVAQEKSYRDQSWKNPKRHPENGIFHPMISWVLTTIIVLH